jgi:hypothetical protein
MNFNNIDTSMFSSPAFLITMAVIALVIIVAAIVFEQRRRRRTAELRARFGPEYDLAVRENRSRAKAENKLQARVDRVRGLKLRELTVAEQARYINQWDIIQARFIDHPRGAVTEADELTNAVMQTMGYPIGGVAQRVEDLSVDHAPLVDSYRTCNGVVTRAGSNQATTEDLRTAMIHYRALFEDLVGVKDSERQAVLARAS